MMTEKLLTEAAFSLNNAIIDQLPSSELCTHTFSAEFEKKMQKVIRRGNHPVLYRQLQRAAILVLVMLLSFAALMVVSPTARARVIAWIREQIAGYTAYSYFGETDSGRENVKYEFGYLPDGYKLQREIEQSGIHFSIFESSEDNGLIYFAYSKDATAIKYFLRDNEYTEYTVVIHNKEGFYQKARESSKANAIIWFDSKQETFFLISAHLEKKDLIQIAEKIKICPLQCPKMAFINVIEYKEGGETYEKNAKQSAGYACSALCSRSGFHRSCNTKNSVHRPRFEYQWNNGPVRTGSCR